MPISTWIRDLFGIRKDVVDTKKAKLEVEKLTNEKRERDLITRCDLQDIEKYDPKHRSLIERIFKEQLKKKKKKTKPKKKKLKKARTRKAKRGPRLIVR